MKVTCLQASECTTTGKSIFSLELEYPRIIHSQLLTHRVFSKNSSSSRAVPVTKMVDQLITDPAEPIFTGKKAGMSGGEITQAQADQAMLIHGMAMGTAVQAAIMMDELGIHKQNANRYLEPFQNIKIVLTSTEWENWDWLRVDADAQPEVKLLAEMVLDARESAEVMSLKPGEWHLPYVLRNRDVSGHLGYYIETTKEGDDKPSYRELSLEQAKDISMSSCGQASYRRLDTSLEKAEDIIPKLFNGKKVHASPSEHQATPIASKGNIYDWEDGVTHMDRKGALWSGNFKGWIQNRQLLPNHDAALMKKDEPTNSDDMADALATAIMGARAG